MGSLPRPLRRGLYSVQEVATILGLCPDKVRAKCRRGEFGKVVRIQSQRIRPGRKRTNVTIFIPYETLLNLVSGKSEVA